MCTRLRGKWAPPAHQQPQTAPLSTFGTPCLGPPLLSGAQAPGPAPNRQTNLREVVRDAATTARQLCEIVHGDAPEVDIVGSCERALAHIPSHIFYMMVELLKNSLRAVCMPGALMGTISSVVRATKGALKGCHTDRAMITRVSLLCLYEGSKCQAAQ